MSLLSKLFGGGHRTDPAGAAKPYLDQIPGVVHEGYDPYVNEGRQSTDKLKEQYDRLMNDPQGFIDELTKGYTTSEGYNFKKGLLTKELSNTAAAGGIAGTPLDQMNQGTAIDQLLSTDLQQYLDNIIGRFDKGLSGHEGVSERGYDATKNRTDALQGALNQQAGLSYHDAEQKNKERNDFFKTLKDIIGGGIGLATQPTASIFGRKLWG